MIQNRYKWPVFLFFTVFIIWVAHLFYYIKYDKFRFQEDIIYFTDEGFWTYPARHKYLYGTWYDSKCHYNHRFFVTPLFNLIEYFSIKTWGLNEMGIRLPSVLFYILIVLLFTFYIVYVRKKSYVLALFVLFPLFIERFFLTQFSMAVLEPLLILLLSTAFLAFILYKREDKDSLLYLSLFFTVVSFFVKPHGILMALPLIVLSEKPIKHKIVMAIIVFAVPLLWNIYIRALNPIAFTAIRYDLFTVPRIKSFTGFLLKDYILNPFHIFITPAFWLVIYILLVKLPVKSIFRENSLSFTIAAVFYFTTVFIMGNTIRYNLAALPAYVTGVVYLYNKKLFLRDRWKSIAILTLLLFGLQFFIRGRFTNTFNDKALLIVSLWLPYLVFYYLYQKMGLSLREILYIIFLVNGLVFISPKVGMSLSTLVYLSYILIVNLLIILFGIKMSGKKTNLLTISFPLFVLLLYILVSPVYIKNEVGYFRGKNRFRNIINSCVEDHNIQFDAVSGRAADNIMLFRKVDVIGVLGPDYEVGSFHRDKGYIHDTSCLTKKEYLYLVFLLKRE